MIKLLLSAWVLRPVCFVEEREEGRKKEEIGSSSDLLFLVRRGRRGEDRGRNPSWCWLGSTQGSMLLFFNWLFFPSNSRFFEVGKNPLFFLLPSLTKCQTGPKWCADLRISADHMRTHSRMGFGILSIHQVYSHFYVEVSLDVWSDSLVPVRSWDMFHKPELLKDSVGYSMHPDFNITISSCILQIIYL